MNQLPDFKQEQFKVMYIAAGSERHHKKWTDTTARHAAYYLTIAALYSNEQWQTTIQNAEQISVVAHRICELMGQDLINELGMPTIGIRTLENNPSIAVIALSLALATRFYISGYRVDQGITWLKAGLCGARLLGDSYWESNLTNDLGLWHKTRGQMLQALAYYRSSSALSLMTHSKAGLASTLNNIGTVYNSTRQTRKAIAYFKKAKAICEAINEHEILADVMNNLALTYLDTKQYEAAREACIAAQNLHSTNSAGLATALNNLGLVHAALGEIEQALVVYQQALELRKQSGSLEELGTTLSNISSTYWSMDRPEEALHYLQLALATFERINATQYIVALLSNQAILKHDTGQLEEAIACLAKAIRLAETHHLSHDGGATSIEDLRDDLLRWQTERTVQETFNSHAELGSIVQEFLDTEDLETAQDYLEQHPTLLGDEIASIFQHLIEATENNTDIQEHFVLHRDLLDLARSYGIERGFQVWQGEMHEKEAHIRLVMEFLLQPHQEAHNYLKKYPLLKADTTEQIIQQLLNELSEANDPADEETIEQIKQNQKLL